MCPVQLVKLCHNISGNLIVRLNPPTVKQFLRCPHVFCFKLLCCVKKFHLVNKNSFFHFLFNQNKWHQQYQSAVCVTKKMYRALVVKKDCGFVSVFFIYVLYFFRLVSNVVVFKNMIHSGPLESCLLKSLNAQNVGKNMKKGH